MKLPQQKKRKRVRHDRCEHWNKRGFHLENHCPHPTRQLWQHKNIVFELPTIKNLCLDMLCVKKVYRDTKSICPLLLSSDEQRAEIVPRINRSTIAFLVVPPLYMACCIFVLLDGRPRDVSTGLRGTIASWAKRSDGFFVLPSPGPAVAPCAASVRPSNGLSGIWNCQLEKFGMKMMFQASWLNRLHTKELNSIESCRIQNTSTPQAGLVELRTAGRLGRAGPAGRDADEFVRAGRNRPSCLPEHRIQHP